MILPILPLDLHLEIAMVNSALVQSVFLKGMAIVSSISQELPIPNPVQMVGLVKFLSLVPMICYLSEILPSLMLMGTYGVRSMFIKSRGKKLISSNHSPPLILRI